MRVDVGGRKLNAEELGAALVDEMNRCADDELDSPSYYFDGFEISRDAETVVFKHRTAPSFNAELGEEWPDFLLQSDVSIQVCDGSRMRVQYADHTFEVRPGRLMKPLQLSISFGEGNTPTFDDLFEFLEGGETLSQVVSEIEAQGYVTIVYQAIAILASSIQELNSREEGVLKRFTHLFMSPV